MSIHLLLVEDEELLRTSFAAAFSKAGYTVSQAANLPDARRMLVEQNPDVVLSDLTLPGGSGIELVKDAARLSPDTIVIYMTAYAGVETAVEAMRYGAFTYLSKPLHYSEVQVWIERALKERRRNRVSRQSEKEEIYIGDVAVVQELRRRVAAVAPARTTVLLLGETGTGKDLVARWLHQASQRKGAFVAINSAGLTGSLLEAELFGHEKGAFTGADSRRIGLVEAAAGGTLFLDEIAEISLELQSRLLRLLDSGKVRRVGATNETTVDVRFIAATNRNIEEEVRQGRFREDLYYRLTTFTIQLPSLRERPDDIPLLADYFARSHANKLGRSFDGLTPSALEFLKRSFWRGNVRELSSSIERALLMADNGVLDSRDFECRIGPDPGASGEDFEAALERFVEEESRNPFHEVKQRLLNAFEKLYLEKALKSADGNISEAARRIGLDRKSFAEKLK